MKATSVLTLLLLLFLSAAGQNRPFKNAFGFKSDNDAYLFYGQDRYYTNGLFLYFRHVGNQQNLRDKLEKVIFEFSAGQKMYNPISGYAPNPAKQDRPFAGYLYAGTAYSRFYKNESILKTELQIGTTGSSSLAEEGQELLHNAVGFYELSGWQYQIKNEFAINVNAHYTRLLHRAANRETDFSFSGNLNLGTTFSGAGAGIMFRAGNFNQLFNTVSTNAEISNNSNTPSFVNHELFFYARPQLNYIAYDATVQGSMFKNNSPVTFGVKPFVFSQQFGFNYTTQRFTIDYSILFKSREIKSSARAHQFGSISMYYRFN